MVFLACWYENDKLPVKAELQTHAPVQGKVTEEEERTFL